MSSWLKLRRPLDRLLAVLLLVVLSPVIAVAGIAKCLEDGGRMLVRLPRVGRHREPLALLKIRSMREIRPDGTADGPSLTARDDDRTTAIGRFLRRWRIDELPQLAHVVAGSMTLLGPRPETPAYVDDGEEWTAVLEAWPGIAGPTQLLVEEIEANLGGDVDAVYRSSLLPVKLRIDRWYVEHASPWIDLLVVAGLLQRFVMRRPAALLHDYVVGVIPGLDDDLERLVRASVEQAR